MEPVSRRRFVLAAVLAAGAGTGGVIAALRDSSDPRRSTGAPATATTTSTRPPTSTTGSTEPSTTPTAAGTAASTTLLCRAAWGARPPSEEGPEHDVARVMVHHSAVVLDDNRRAPERLRAHQAHHLREGFSDLAYHLVVDGHGHVYEGRDPSTPGETFTDYDPTGWLLVTCEGNFDEQAVPQRQLDALVDVLAWASEHFGVGVDAIVPHNDVSPTACPGAALAGRLRDGSLLERVATVVERGGVRLERVCGSEAARIVEAVETGHA